jgi:hypothetical protein
MSAPSPRADQWGGTVRAAALLGCAPATVKRVAVRAGIRVKRVPGLWPKYNLPDLERVACEAEQPAAG